MLAISVCLGNGEQSSFAEQNKEIEGDIALATSVASV
jgi:hypothetical protein